MAQLNYYAGLKAKPSQGRTLQTPEERRPRIYHAGEVPRCDRLLGIKQYGRCHESLLAASLHNP